MKIDDAVETIAHFFNDLIGTLIPGIVLVAGLLVMHIDMPIYMQGSVEHADGFLVFVLLSLFFATGHAVLALHSALINPILRKSSFIPEDPLSKLSKKQPYLIFEKLMSTRMGELPLGKSTEQGDAKWSYNDLRSLAFTISPEAASLGRRFMFISLLCNGVATAIFILLLDYVVCVMIAPHLIVQYESALPVLMQVILLISVAGLLFKRGEEFYARAMSAPFPVALSEFINNRRTDAA